MNITIRAIHIQTECCCIEVWTILVLVSRNCYSKKIVSDRIRLPNFIDLVALSSSGKHFKHFFNKSVM